MDDLQSFIVSRGLGCTYKTHDIPAETSADSTKTQTIRPMPRLSQQKIKQGSRGLGAIQKLFTISAETSAKAFHPTAHQPRPLPDHFKTSIAQPRPLLDCFLVRLTEPSSCYKPMFCG